MSLYYGILTHSFIFNKKNIIFLYFFTTVTRPTDAMTRPFQVYTCRPRPPPRPLVEASSMPQSSPAPVSQLFDDLPIVTRKCTRSTSNPHPIYNFLNFHRLSLPYVAFVSTLSFVSTLKSTSKTLSHSG